MTQVCFNLNSLGRVARSNESADVSGPSATDFIPAMMQDEPRTDALIEVARLTYVDRVESILCSRPTENVDARNRTELRSNEVKVRLVTSETCAGPSDLDRRR